MHIESEHARSIAHNSMLAPYRQIKVMGTRDFATWLQKRDIRLGQWETLHGMWATGALNAVGARDVGRLNRSNPIFDVAQVDRLERIAVIEDVGFYADRGLDITTDGELTASKKYPYSLDDAVQWHPLQLWAFHRIQRRLSAYADWSIRLHDAERLIDFHRMDKELSINHVRKFVTGADYASFQKLLRLMLEVEPWIHGTVYSVLHFDVFDQDVDTYLQWRDSQDTKGALLRSELSLDEAIKWHETLAVDARMADPIGSFRRLLRHADRRKREQLKGSALLAHTLYDHAETLRRYLEVYWQQSLPEEPDVLAIKSGSKFNLERYGSERITDYNRSVMKRITRQHGVDASYAAYLFLEGETEVAFVKHWMKSVGVTPDNQGILLRNVRGIQNINLLIDEIRMLRNEEVFAVICLDEDQRGEERRASHIETLEELQRDGQLPVEYEIWKPNFVEANFTLEEIVELANQRLVASRMPESVTIGALKASMQIHDETRLLRTAEDALFDILPLTRRDILAKGKPLGKALAEWAWAHPAPSGTGKERERPIEKIMRMVLRARESSYPLTLEIAQEKRKARRNGL